MVPSIHIYLPYFAGVGQESRGVGWELLERDREFACLGNCRNTRGKNIHDVVNSSELLPPDSYVVAPSR